METFPSIACCSSSDNPLPQIGHPGQHVFEEQRLTEHQRRLSNKNRVAGVNEWLMRLNHVCIEWPISWASVNTASESLWFAVARYTP